MVQWLRLSIPNVEGVGSIPGQGTKTPCGKEKKNWGHRKTLCQEPHRILLGFNRIRYANPQICHFGKKTVLSQRQLRNSRLRRNSLPS